MNWTRFLLNIGGVAAAAFGSTLSAGAAGAPISGKAIGVTIGAAVVSNVIGLFQQPPHQQAPTPDQFAPLR